MSYYVMVCYSIVSKHTRGLLIYIYIYIYTTTTTNNNIDNTKVPTRYTHSVRRSDMPIILIKSLVKETFKNVNEISIHVSNILIFFRIFKMLMNFQDFLFLFKISMNVLILIHCTIVI